MVEKIQPTIQEFCKERGFDEKATVLLNQYYEAVLNYIDSMHSSPDAQRMNPSGDKKEWHEFAEDAALAFTTLRTEEIVK